MENSENVLNFKDVTFNDGKFFGINYYGKMVTIDFKTRSSPEMVTIMPLNSIFWNIRSGGCSYCFVHPISSKLIQVYGDVEYAEDTFVYKTFGFRMFKIDYNSEGHIGYEAVENLGDCTLFLGFNSSIAVPSSLLPDNMETNLLY